MKKQSERTDGAGTQLGFELEFGTVQPPDFSSASPAVAPASAVQSSVVDLTPLLQRRAAESDRAILKAVLNRAAHLSDCLRK